MRTKLVVEANGGTCTGKPNEVKECKLQECPGIFIYIHKLSGHILMKHVNSQIGTNIIK